ncbi:RimJ/RimL family protein N-acetyltransferase [Nonlabens dokdonensis]|uniref:Acetyltransferase, gnat family n=2 Tax=Nonlabens dokdonensis TaxID=328515 RepID=L7W6I3_NONDD|nr:GNAT family protein [Nonlabens dokdonensis]AGC75739.1 acetyltransferase, gnat family [Nonlabens dokdonensis DSW-6]PZX43424.1 RimJ/RimL family protein N-acetyltransferase [Nonlabens dokdonensis]
MYSERLTYKLLEISDLEELHELNLIPEVDQFNTMGLPDSIQVTKDLLDAKIEDHQQENISKLTYSIRLTDNSEFIGISGILFGQPKYKKAELWMKFNPKFWNQGYATETITRLLKACFEEYQLHRVEAGCAIENHASKKVLEKCGFVVEGVQRKNLPLKTGWSDNYEFGILEEEYLDKNRD